MNYIEVQKQLFNRLATPEWSRVNLPVDIFPVVDSARFGAVAMHQIGSAELSDLRQIIADPSANDGLPGSRIEDFLNLDAAHGENLGAKFCSYINSRFNHGVLIHAKQGESKQLYLDYQLSENDALLVDHHLIVAGENSDIEIVCDYRSLDQSEQQHYGSIKVIAGAGARVKLTVFQRLNDRSYSFQQFFSDLAEAADVTFNDVQIGSAVKAVASVQYLAGRHANAATHSLYFGQQGSATDLCYTAKHKGQKSTSTIFSKGALKKDSKKVFRGNLFFERGAKQAVGREEEFVLLLNKKLKSDSIPGLFCQEDDVIGEHAASVGQVDEGVMFYMMSRGFDESEAKRLMIQSGYAEVVQKMSIGDLGKLIVKSINERIS